MAYTYRDYSDIKDVEVTQEWVDSAQKSMNKLAKKLLICEAVTKLHVIKDVALIDQLGRLLKV